MNKAYVDKFVDKSEKFCQILRLVLTFLPVKYMQFDDDISLDRVVKHREG